MPRITMPAGDGRTFDVFDPENDRELTNVARRRSTRERERRRLTQPNPPNFLPNPIWEPWFDAYDTLVEKNAMLGRRTQLDPSGFGFDDVNLARDPAWQMAANPGISQQGFQYDSIRALLDEQARKTRRR